MATSTISAEVALVNVIAAMTTDAIGGRWPIFIHRPHVTLGAGQIRMAPVELKAGFQRVIEHPYRPGYGRMAAAALRAERCIVNVAVDMAVDALRRSIVEPLRGMTGIAFDAGVFADQREARQSVVKTDIEIPAGFVVALFARFTELCPVRIVIDMTGMAVTGQWLFIDRRHVAITAGQAEMSAEQPVSRIPAVIKGDSRPVARNVTGAAVLPVQTLVLVIVAMTAETVRRHTDRMHRFDVTCAAFRPGMRPRQRE